MSIRDKQNINILNYNDHIVIVSTRDKSYLIEPARDGIPSKTPFSFSEVETINSGSNAFTSGTLRFEESEEGEIYHELRIVDWENILTNEEIKNIVFKPSFDGLNKIVEIKNSSIFERVRGIFTKLKNENSDDISMRVERIINERYKELLNGVRKSEIQLTKKDVESKNFEDASIIKAENAQLKNEMAELKDMVSKLLNSKVDHDNKEISTGTQKDKSKKQSEKSSK